MMAAAMDNLNDIISNLTSDDIDMLKGVASSILGEQAKQDTPAKKAENAIAQNSLPLDNIDFDMVMKAKKIFDKMNSASNKNTDLIMALKPHLSPETQSKADQAVRILKLFEVLPLLRELF